MSRKTVFFDLDGTLLPMDQSIFIRAYIGGISKRLAPYGYEPDALVKAIWDGTAAMVANNGSVTNEEAFWQSFTARFGEECLTHVPIFDAYYQEDFDKVQTACGFAPQSREILQLLHSRGVDAVLATNPIFPAIATQKRIGWAGLLPTDFKLITTYENSRHCKPNPDYYRDILKTLNLRAEDCLMIGNDVEEDMIAETLGMKVFLLTDCLINKHEKPIDRYPHGSFPELIEFLEKILD